MRDAAKFLNKPYTTYVNHEKGYRELKSEELKEYAKQYGVSVDYLLGRTDIKTPITTKDNEREKEVAEFMNIISQLSPENAALLKDQAQILLKHQKFQDNHE